MIQADSTQSLGTSQDQVEVVLASEVPGESANKHVGIVVDATPAQQDQVPVAVVSGSGTPGVQDMSRGDQALLSEFHRQAYNRDMISFYGGHVLDQVPVISTVQADECIAFTCPCLGFYMAQEQLRKQDPLVSMCACTLCWPCGCGAMEMNRTNKFMGGLPGGFPMYYLRLLLLPWCTASQYFRAAKGHKAKEPVTNESECNCDCDCDMCDYGIWYCYLQEASNSSSRAPDCDFDDCCTCDCGCCPIDDCSGPCDLSCDMDDDGCCCCEC